MKIGLVGTCTSGKSTIGRLLEKDGYLVRQIAQEHSYVQDMWRRISNPDVLIYLEVSYENTLRRRRLNWKKSDYDAQLARLEHARQHADLSLDTNLHSPDQIYQLILEYLDTAQQVK